jgi:hypothetical protein
MKAVHGRKRDEITKTATMAFTAEVHRAGASRAVCVARGFSSADHFRETKYLAVRLGLMTVAFTFRPAGSMLECEQQIQAALDEAGTLATATCLERFGSGMQMAGPWRQRRATVAEHDQNRGSLVAVLEQARPLRKPKRFIVSFITLLRGHTHFTHPFFEEPNF